MDGGAWWATVYRVAKSQTRLSDFTFTFNVLHLKLIKYCKSTTLKLTKRKAGVAIIFHTQ